MTYLRQLKAVSDQLIGGVRQFGRKLHEKCSSTANSAIDWTGTKVDQTRKLASKTGEFVTEKGKAAFPMTSNVILKFRAEKLEIVESHPWQNTINKVVVVFTTILGDILRGAGILFVSASKAIYGKFHGKPSVDNNPPEANLDQEEEMIEEEEPVVEKIVVENGIRKFDSIRSYGNSGCFSQKGNEANG